MMVVGVLKTLKNTHTLYLSTFFFSLWSSKILPSTEFHGCQTDVCFFLAFIHSLNISYFLLAVRFQMFERFRFLFDFLFLSFFLISIAATDEKTHMQDTALRKSSIPNKSHLTQRAHVDIIH